MPTDPAAISAIKKLFFEQALAFGEVGVRFIADAPGVEMPDFLEREPGTVQTFIYGLNQPRPIPDLAAGTDGVRATLAFGRQAHMTSVPWAAVVAMGGVEFGIVFPVPVGKIEEMHQAEKDPAVSATHRASDRDLERRGLKLVR